MQNINVGAAFIFALGCISASEAADTPKQTPMSHCGQWNWNDRRPADAPTLPVRPTWRYVADKIRPPTVLTLIDVEDGVNRYTIAPDGTHKEYASTYSELVPSRTGTKVLLSFPLRVGSSWTDEFKEVGEYQSTYEHYVYEYEEHSTSTVLGLETIDVAAGRFRTFHIQRIAHWAKTAPRDLGSKYGGREWETDNKSVTGVTITHLWYAPAVGRGVLKATMRVGDDSYIPDAASFLNYANASIIELQSYSDDRGSCQGKAILRARQPDMYFPPGYAVAPNTSWEWALQMREHRARLTTN